MLADARSMHGSVLEPDVCIVGAGPAGITVARELIDGPLSVLVLESGAFEADPNIQRLSHAPVDSPYHAADAAGFARRRQFGGTANTWIYRTQPDDGRRYARSVPPEPIDLAPLPPMHDGWPLQLDAMGDHFARAQHIWSGGPGDFSVERWADSGAQPVAFADGVLQTRISQHGPRDVFAVRYRDELLAAENVQLLMGATALRLEPHGAGGEVQRLAVGLPDGGLATVAAKAFVLACGAIENAQLLLASEAARPGAVGNQHDTVGRYLTDHQEFRMGSLEPDPGMRDALGLYDLRWVGRFLVAGFLTIDEQVKRSEGLLNLSAALVLHGRGFGTPAHRALASMMALQHRKLPPSFVRSVAALARAPGDTLALVRSRDHRYQEWSGGWSRPEVDRNLLPMIEVHAATEQTADRENRVFLDGTRDELGRPRAAVRWRWSRVDRDNIERSIAIVADAMGAAGMGHFERWGPLAGPNGPRFPGIHHPMTSTRMHPDPELGVVDPDCRVHGLDNVYVAGSSVFPSGLGYANPTLTILALAVRLADHLKDRLHGALEES